MSVFVTHYLFPACTEITHLLEIFTPSTRKIATGRIRIFIRSKATVDHVNIIQETNIYSQKSDCFQLPSNNFFEITPKELIS